MNAQKIALTLPLAAALLAATATTTPASAAYGGPWSSAWGASPQRPAHTSWFPNWSEGGFADQSVRQVIRVGAEGSEVRVRVTNRYGKTPLKLTGATVARTAGGPAVQPDSVRALRFEGVESVTVPAGGELSSDAVALPVKAFEQLTVTFYFEGPTGPATFHNVAMSLSYRAVGDHRRDASADAFAAGAPSFSWYYLAGVDVKNPRPGAAGTPGGSRKAVVAFGDSLTDGYGATPGADLRYPDQLAKRLVADGRSRPVLNAGIGGNKVLGDSECFGESALARFRRDALGRPDVGTVIVLEGTNDIVQPDGPQDHCTAGSPKVTAEEIIAGHRELVREARTRGVRVIGATIPPFHGSRYWTERGEDVRTAVNHWIRTGGAYDGVVDFDRVLAAPADPAHPKEIKIKDEYALAGDRLHMNDAGYRAMADAFDLNSL
ncbi:SGNH/GDSL hydrolase family protein [Streptomyces sp. NPDC091371]|uniref:SGNH/GDSL hydrolase family protein n=1 Tax=Streptomyces sp. NPDC091371 TaxID=3155303 RepID=UPI003417AC62